MEKGFRKLIPALVCLLSMSRIPAQTEPMHILVIHSYHQDLPWTAGFQKGLTNARKNSIQPIEFHFEYLDSARLEHSVDPLIFTSYLQSKYSNVRFDAIFGESDAASMYIAEYGDFFGEIPHLFYGAYSHSSKKQDYTLLNNLEEAVEKTFAAALLIQPDPPVLAVISGADPSSNPVELLVRKHADARGIHNIQVFRNYQMDEMVEKISTLPSGSIVFYTPVVSDITGKRFIPKDVLARISYSPDIQIYTFWSSLLGNGALGGYMLDAEETAKQMLKATTDYIQNGYFGDEYNNLKCLFDWKVMESHRISPKKIPHDAHYINHPVSFFISYYRELLTISAGVISLFLTLSLISLFSIRRANRKLVIANSELEKAWKTAETIASTDTLTGLLNRRATLPVISHEMQRKKRLNTPVSMMLIDIDHFKTVNDIFGHDAGDTSLKALSSLFQKYCRTTDTIARWGGEEFLLLASDTAGTNAYVLAEKLRQAVVDNDLPPDGFTISIGVSEHIEGETFDQWFKRVDSALYQAKNSGRNRVVAVTGESLPEQGKDIGLYTFNLTWKDEYTSGNNIIDRQHRKLFTLSNRLTSAVLNQEQRPVIENLLDEFLVHASGHFTDEERILKAKKYSGLKYHSRLHTDLIHHLGEGIRQYKKHSLDEYEFLKFLSHEIILDHILKEDTLFFDLVREPA